MISLKIWHSHPDSVHLQPTAAAQALKPEQPTPVTKPKPKPNPPAKSKPPKAKPSSIQDKAPPPPNPPPDLPEARSVPARSCHPAADGAARHARRTPVSARP